MKLRVFCQIIKARAGHAAALVAFTAACPAATWITNSPLSIAREYHTAAVLRNGKVLVVGGLYSDGVHTLSLASAELYEPTTGFWCLTGSLTNGSWYHTATLLPNRKGLIAGGWTNDYAGSTCGIPPGARAPLGGALALPRTFHAATLLRTGKVLISGGDGPFGATASAELLPVGYALATMFVNGIPGTAGVVRLDPPLIVLV